MKRTFKYENVSGDGIFGHSLFVQCVSERVREGIRFQVIVIISLVVSSLLIRSSSHLLSMSHERGMNDKRERERERERMI